MTTFYFIRHGEKNLAEKNLKFYHGPGDHMLTLSELGIEQITAAARDERLKEAELIITSPFGRALHSAAILSNELGLDIRVETPTCTSGCRMSLITNTCRRKKPTSVIRH